MKKRKTKPGGKAHLSDLSKLAVELQMKAAYFATVARQASDAVGNEGVIGNKLFMVSMTAAKCAAEANFAIKYLKEADK